MERIDQGGGFSVLDGAALVVGAAIASVHVLGIRRSDLSGGGWIMIALTFCWVCADGGWPIPLSGPEIHPVVAELSQGWGPPLGDAWTAVVRDRSSSVGHSRH